MLKDMHNSIGIIVFVLLCCDSEKLTLETVLNCLLFTLPPEDKSAFCSHALFAIVIGKQTCQQTRRERVALYHFINLVPFVIYIPKTQNADVCVTTNILDFSPLYH